MSWQGFHFELMCLQTARSEFEARYFLWAKEQIAKEALHGFPSLRAFSDGNPIRFLEYARNRTSEDCVNLLVARLKRLQPQAAAAFGESISASEQALIKEFDDSPILHGQSKVEGNNGIQATQEGLLVDRKRLRLVIRNSLRPLLGDRIFERDSATWVHVSPIKKWYLCTEIDIGGRLDQLSYNHYIKQHDFFTTANNPNLNSASFSVLSWLGVQGGATRWRKISNQNISETVSRLTMFCSCFIDAAPLLLPEAPVEELNPTRQP
jgi:hypothetical protein